MSTEIVTLLEGINPADFKECSNPKENKELLEKETEQR